MEIFQHPLTWLAVTLLLLAAFTFAPLRIQNDDTRFFVMRWVLTPLSILFIAYSYPMGIELVRRFATGS
jgi:hypothetical protein